MAYRLFWIDISDGYWGLNYMGLPEQQSNFDQHWYGISYIGFIHEHLVIFEVLCIGRNNQKRPSH